MGFFFFLFFLFLILFFITKFVSSKEIPSSSSTSASGCALSAINIPQRKYDVFLSFRGEDTRNTFTGHLHQALLRNKIETFMDDQLIRGDEISPSLLNAIEGSTISIIVFSERYASSGWCLEELVKILECKNTYGQIVIPIFYHVDPSHVRNQKGTFGDSFLKLEERFKGRLEKLQKWRVALKEAANLSGFDSDVIRYEPDLIQKIVEEILKKLKDKFPSDFNKDLIGVESRIEEIESLLSYGQMGVYTLGIWGMGGIGKTTIARTFFKKIKNQFESSHFIPNIRESEKIGGLTQLTQLQRELFFKLLGDRNLNTSFYSFDFDFEIERLSRKKVLIVFDDVTNFEQINCLIGSFDRFLPGSLIIVTTRDKHTLKNCGVKIIYEIEKLEDVDALKLFSWHAFRQSHPDTNYEKLSDEVMQYAQGVPLVLKVLGCFLYTRRESEWESEINRLKSIPHDDVQQVLKISYDGLDRTKQKIFLDIACFFNGENKDLVEKFFDACGLSPVIEISVLVERSLVVISYGRVIMHDLLQEMGREIVRQEYVDNPENRSRLWNHEDVYEVLTCNMGTQAIQGIYLNMDRVKEISLNLNTFMQMPNLRFLKFYGRNKFKISDFGSEGYIFHKLRYLHWDGYPLKSLSSNIGAENLVFLELPQSNVEQLWDGVQNLVNLKKIDLNRSIRLTKLPNLSNSPKLEELILDGTAIEELPSSIVCLPRLNSLYLCACGSLKSLSSNLFNLKSLRYLNLSYCSNLKSLPEFSSCNLEELDLSDSAIEELPSSIVCLSKLEILDLRQCLGLKSLPSYLFNLKSLRYLYLSFCSNLKSLPEISSCNLERLHLIESAIEELPSSIDCLSRLDSLDLSESIGLKSLPSNLFNLKSLRSLNLSYSSNFKSLPEISSCNLEQLILPGTAIEELPSSIEFLSRLETLYLGNCSRLNSLPSSLCKLKSLESLDLTGCSNLQRLPEEIGNLVLLKDLRVTGSGITKVPSSIICLKSLDGLHLERLRGHEQVGFILRPSDGLRGLKFLSLIDCGITKLPKSLFKLSTLISLCLDKNKFERIPKSIISLCKLHTLSLNHCERLQFLPNLPSSVKCLSAIHCSSLEALSNIFTIGPYYPFFDFGNCLKLDQNELKNIVNKAAAKLNIESTGLGPQHMRYPTGLGLQHMRYPGSEIPEFFKFKNMGSSLTFKTPPGFQFHSTCIKYVVCLVVSFGDHYESDRNFNLIFIWKTRTVSFENASIRIIGCVKSDHVILALDMVSMCLCSRYGREYLNNPILEMHLVDSYSERIDCSGIVKKWGIHFLKA